MSVLKTCPYCGGHGYINQFEDVEGGCRAWSNECIACKGTGSILVPETNADRIRRMSDEELAEYQAQIVGNTALKLIELFRVSFPPEESEKYITDLKSEYLRSLKLPVEEDT